MPVRRTAVAIAAIAAAGLVPAIGSSATAAGHGHASAQNRQLTHQIAGIDRRLARLESSRAVTSLADTDEQALDANIDADRTQLATVVSRQDLRTFRVANYVLAATILHRAERLSAAAASVPAAQDELSQAISAALSLNASSSKTDVRGARSHLSAAQTDIDDQGENTDNQGDDTSGDDAAA